MLFFSFEKLLSHLYNGIFFSHGVLWCTIGKVVYVIFIKDTCVQRIFAIHFRWSFDVYSVLAYILKASYKY